MFWCGESLLQSCENDGQIACYQGSWVEPESWKNATAKKTSGVRLQGNVLTVLKAKPAECSIVDLPAQILLHLVAAVDVFFLVEVVGSAAGGNFDDQFRRAFDIIVFTDNGLSSSFKTQQAVRLGFVFCV